VLVGRPEEAPARFRDQEPDAAILDLAMTGADGFAVLAAIRRGSDVPVLAIGARECEADHLRALELGADDYVLKPLGPHALMARLNALIRRTRAAPAPAPVGLQVGDLRMDFASKSVWVRGRPLSLGEREYALLYQLASSPDRLLSPETLTERVWGPDWGAGPADVKSLVHRLRAKLQGPDGAGASLIETARGRGYRLAATAPRLGEGRQAAADVSE
jgi:two-component system, OmpR family, KDP operon response regulator KdpE